MASSRDSRLLPFKFHQMGFFMKNAGEQSSLDLLDLLNAVSTFTLPIIDKKYTQIRKYVSLP